MTVESVYMPLGRYNKSTKAEGQGDCLFPCTDLKLECYS